MSNKKSSYYVVWSGKEPGVYDNWHDCELQVKGVEGAKYKGFKTKEEAEKAFQASPSDYIQRKSQPASQPALLDLPDAERPLFPALAVDGACSGNPGKMEYRGVDAETGAELFHFGPVPGGTNNIAEFLAIVHALALMKQWAQQRPDMANYYLNLRIYSDSKTAQSWVKQRKCKTKLAPTEENRLLFPIIQRAENWLLVNTYTNPIVKWKTESWGEIPADFGRK